MRTLAPSSWLALLLCACGATTASQRALAPLPPHASMFPVDEARAAFGSELPADALRVRTPAWASLEQVLGTYDPPFVSESAGSIVFGDDDRSLVVVRRNGQVRVWDRARHETTRRWDGCVDPAPENTTRGAAERFVSSHDGLAAIGFRAGHFCIIDTTSGEKVVEIRAYDLWPVAALSLPGSSGVDARGSTTFVARLVAGRLVTYAYRGAQGMARGDGKRDYIPAAGGELRIWDARTGRKLSDVRIGAFRSADLSPDGTRFVGSDGDLRFFDTSGRVLWTKPGSHAPLAFASNERILAVRGERLVDIETKDGAVRVFPAGHRPLRADVGSASDPVCTDCYLPHVDSYVDLIPTPSGRHVVAIRDYEQHLELWDVAARAEVAHSTANAQTPDDWAPSPSGALLVVPSYSVPIVRTRTLDVFHEAKGQIQLLLVSGEGDRVMAGHLEAGSTFDLWDLRAHKLERPPRRVESLRLIPTAAPPGELSSDESRVLVRTDNRIEVRDVATDRVVFGVPVSRDTPAALSPDGQTLAMLAWDDARKTYTPTLWSVTKGLPLWQNAEAKPFQYVLTFDATGERIAVYGFDKRFTFLDTHNGAVLYRTPPVTKPRRLFMRDGFALVADDQGFGVVDLETWQSRWRVQAHYPRLEVPRSADFFFELDEGVVRRRNLRTGVPIGEPIDLAPSDDSAVNIATSNDGKTLIVGTARGVLLRFRLRE